jgi:hypothetical protein
MTAPILTSLFQLMNRRRFLSSAAATTVWAGVAAIPEEAETASTPAVIRFGPPERPRSDIESWNLGLITACRPGLSPAENLARGRQLWADPLHIGRLHVRGAKVVLATTGVVCKN